MPSCEASPDPAPASPVPASSRGSRRWAPSLAVVLAAGLWLRWPNPEPGWTHVDEGAFVTYPLGFFSGDLNPHFFNYPTLQLYLAAGVDYAWWVVAGQGDLIDFAAYRYFVDAGDILLLARGLATLMAVATIAATALLARRLYGDGGALFAAACLAALPLHVRFAHLAATDVPMALWSTLAVLWSVRATQGHRWGDLVAAGAFCGLAGATKYPGVLAFAAVVVASWQLPAHRLRALAAACLACIAAFAIATPFVWLDWRTALRDLSVMAGEHAVGTAHGVALPPAVHLVVHNLRYGLGWLGLLGLAAALLWRPWQLAAGERIVAAAMAAFLCFAGASSSVFQRYAVPAAPLAAILLVRALRLLPARPLVTGVAAAFALSEPLYASIYTRHLLGAGDTRVEATRLMAGVRPEGGRVVLFSGAPGRPPLLTPDLVYNRERRFRQSYGPARLAAVYERLARRADLPPLWVVSDPPSARILAATGGPRGVEAVACRLSHPLCDPTDGHRAFPEFVDAVNWTIQLSPGTVRDAAYDPVDWLFVPLGGFSGVDRTGPAIDLGVVRVDRQAPVPTAPQFFGALARLAGAAAARAAGDWAGASLAYEDLLRRRLALDEVLSHRDRVELLHGGAAARYAARDKAGAVALWLLAIDADPDNTGLRYNAGATLRELGRTAEAAYQLLEVVRRDPAHRDAWVNLASTLYELGRFNEALLAAQRVLELSLSADAFIRLGMIRAQLGDRAGTRDAYGRALELEPQNPLAESLRQTLEEGMP